jgi:hypothetical protein
LGKRAIAIKRPPVVLVNLRLQQVRGLGVVLDGGVAFFAEEAGGEEEGEEKVEKKFWKHRIF